MGLDNKTYEYLKNWAHRTTVYKDTERKSISYFLSEESLARLFDDQGMLCLDRLPELLAAGENAILITPAFSYNIGVELGEFARHNKGFTPALEQQFFRQYGLKLVDGDYGNKLLRSNVPGRSSPTVFSDNEARLVERYVNLHELRQRASPATNRLDTDQLAELDGIYSKYTTIFESAMVGRGKLEAWFHPTTKGMEIHMPQKRAIITSRRRKILTDLIEFGLNNGLLSPEHTEGLISRYKLNADFSGNRIQVKAPPLERSYHIDTDSTYAGAGDVDGHPAERQGDAAISETYTSWGGGHRRTGRHLGADMEGQRSLSWGDSLDRTGYARRPSRADEDDIPLMDRINPGLGWNR